MPLVSLEKLFDRECHAKVWKQICAVHKDKSTMAIAPRFKTTGIYVMGMINPKPNVKLKHKITVLTHQ